MIDFIAKAVTEVALELNKGKEKEKKSNTGDEADEEEEDMHPLLLNFIEFLLEVSKIGIMELNNNLAVSSAHISIYSDKKQ